MYIHLPFLLSLSAAFIWIGWCICVSQSNKDHCRKFIFSCLVSFIINAFISKSENCHEVSSIACKSLVNHKFPHLSLSISQSHICMFASVCRWPEARKQWSSSPWMCLPGNYCHDKSAIMCINDLSRTTILLRAASAESFFLCYSLVLHHHEFSVP